MGTSKSSFFIFNFLFVYLTFLLPHTPIAHPDECYYTVQVQTGWIENAGTDAVIGVTFKTPHDELLIPNLQQWGVMGPNYDYFERGHLDDFIVKGPCMRGNICYIRVTSDGSGNKPGWYCSFIQVSVGVVEKLFGLDQWLAIDSPPYSLTATRNNCPKIKGNTSILELMEIGSG